MADVLEVPKGYSFVRVISSGGFGSVVELIENSTQKHYAGKMMQCVTAKDKERINREVNRLRKFAHPGIVGLKELPSMGITKVIVMELGEQSLADIVKDHRSRGVLVARELYVSPERMESETGRATCSSDVWALGIVLHWLLFGEPPFKSQNAARLIREISSFRVSTIGSDCGGEERALLMRMLDPNPETRVTSCQLCSFGVFRCLVNTPSGVWRLKDADEKEHLDKEENLTRELHSKEEKWKKELEMEKNARTRAEEANKRLETDLKKEKERTAQLESEMAKLRTNQIHPSPQPQPTAYRTISSPLYQAHPERRQGTGGRSQIGAAAIELFNQTRWTVSENVFTKTQDYYASLLSFVFEAVVARLSFTIKTGQNASFIVGIISPSLSNETLTDCVTRLKGGAGWDLYPICRSAEQNWKETNKRSACLGGREGQRVVMEADGREGKRTLKLSQDGETAPVFFTNFPVPFRFAVCIRMEDEAVEIESVEVVSSPQMVGGTIAVPMDE
ncbi:hypothetical protein BLNAU_10779 [Blattamonas nauphoetae]|uniref:Protein kinase domain-containing protein n=1 Tax=Blattamonas nauphoetae TaxID=2049346 RepID=A0ABQ9XT07_9EUKA|nr:hypothetical protein BLNAU_10779 [Blattamonas nauphoetae]